MEDLLPIQLMICYNENLARACSQGWKKRQRFESAGLRLLLHVPMVWPCLFPSVSEEEARIWVHLEVLMDWIGDQSPTTLLGV